MISTKDIIQNNKYNNFHLIRHAAALMVIIGHAYPITGQVGIPSVLGMGIHTLGVKIFFVLSGYLIVDSYLRDPNLFRFFLRRILRLFPALLFVVIATIFIIGPYATVVNLTDYFSNLQTYLYLRNIALYIIYYLPGVFEDNPIKFAMNGSLWTLPVEFFCYTLIGLILLLKNRNLIIFISLSLFFVICFWLYTLNTTKTDTLLVIYATNVKASASIIIYFLIGSVIRLFNIAKKLSLQFFIIALIFFVSIPNFSLIQFAAPLVLIPVGTFSFAFSKPILKWINKGDISYGLYLWAFPIGQLLYNKQIATTLYTSIFFTILFTVPVAFLSWYLIEKPALRLKPRIKTSLYKSDR